MKDSPIMQWMVLASKAVMMICTWGFIILVWTDRTHLPSHAQDFAPIKFALSESESLRLENLRLRRQVLLLRLNQLQAEMRQQSSEAVAFAQETLKAHGSPAGVSFNEQTLDFVIAPPKPEVQNLRKPESPAKREKP